jgi:hypothetical protein
MTRRILATVALIALSLFATLPETSEGLPRPVYPGADYSAAALVPGAPQAAVAPASPESEHVRPRGAPSSEPAGRTVTTERLNPMPATRSGIWSYADPSHGPLYLAIPEGRGWRVTVCGPLACLERTSTDAGPDLFLQRKGRIGDLSWRDFLAVCGPLSRGICDGSYAIGGRALPETSTGGER